MLRPSFFWWSVMFLGYFFLKSAEQVCMKRTVTWEDFLDRLFSVSGYCVCHESHDQWRSMKRKLCFRKEVFKHYLNLACATKTQVYAKTMHLSWMLASIFSPVTLFLFVFHCLLIIFYLNPPESCSDTSCATYCAFELSRMHKFWVRRNGFVQSLQELLQIVKVY